MSRGFVKEDDQEEAPFIPPRAALPPGEINYVTPKGYQELMKEREAIESELSSLDIEDEKEKRHRRATLTGSLNLLNERIASARILKLEDQAQDEVRFGATVTFKLEGKQSQKFQLVGVDEADIKKNKIAFVAPISRGITGKKVGETAEVFMGGQNQTIEILEISYS